MKIRKGIVSSSKGQMKVQQMAFVLVALFIFFTLVALVYFSIISQKIVRDASFLREEGAKQEARAITGIPEFIWTFEDCVSCIDFDKALMIKERVVYDSFWNQINFFQFRRLEPRYETEECTRINYPECNSITVIDADRTNAVSTFVALCYYDKIHNFKKCDLGLILMGVKEPS